MNIELRQLRCLVAIVDCGTLTDAAIDLGVSQAAVSRTLAALEADLGVRLLRRTTRTLSPTPAGSRVITRARRLLAEADELEREATSGHADLRLGHAWSALGRHTTAFQRRWAAAHPTTSLHLVRTNSPTAGLAEGACDVAVLRSGRTRNGSTARSSGSNGGCSASPPTTRGRVGVRSRWPRSARASCSSTVGQAPPRPTCGPPASAPRPRTSVTSTTGSPPSAPAGSSASPPRPPRPSTAARTSPTARSVTSRPFPSAWPGGATTPTPPPTTPSALATELYRKG